MRRIVVGMAGLASLGAATSAEAHQCYRLTAEPAQYRMVEEQVLVSPAREIPEFTPAVTRQVEETVVVRPEQTLTRVIPAAYGYEQETVLISPPRREWRARNEEGQTIGCWVTVPAIYGAVTHRVIVRPAQEVSETIPAETATRLRTEIVEPARTVTQTIPARYETRERQELVAPASSRWAPIDGECQD
jgi:hypothetical protein